MALAGSPLEQSGGVCEAGLPATSGNWSRIGMVPKGEGGYLKVVTFCFAIDGLNSNRLGFGETVM